jgi:L-threonylcarbamoyladenylate synthase
VTAGLDTVAVRCRITVALKLIKLAGVPIASAAANLSGSPSPTEAKHVISDLSGKIAAIVDGGPCTVGVESTIVDLSEYSGRARILRPGGITPEQLSQVLGDVMLDSAVTRALKEGETARAPGMKYRHYAPKAQVILISGDIEKAADYVNRQDPETTGVLCFDEEAPFFKAGNILTYGGTTDYKTQARKLFSCLREFDSRGVGTIYARCPKSSGVGLAVANRLSKASGYQIIEV